MQCRCTPPSYQSHPICRRDIPLPQHFEEGTRCHPVFNIGETGGSVATYCAPSSYVSFLTVPIDAWPRPTHLGNLSRKIQVFGYNMVRCTRSATPLSSTSAVTQSFYPTHPTPPHALALALALALVYHIRTNSNTDRHNLTIRHAQLTGPYHFCGTKILNRLSVYLKAHFPLLEGHNYDFATAKDGVDTPQKILGCSRLTAYPGLTSRTTIKEGRHVSSPHYPAPAAVFQLAQEETVHFPEPSIRAKHNRAVFAPLNPSPQQPPLLRKKQNVNPPKVLPTLHLPFHPKPESRMFLFLPPILTPPSEK
jgi:hypothetical protein